MVLQNLKKAMYGVVAWEPLFGALCRSRLADKVVVLMYHEIAEDDADIEAWTVIKRSDFSRQMEYLRACFDVVSLSEALARMVQPGGSGRPMAVVTFDDGDAGNRQVLLPLVREINLPVTIFVSTAQVQDQKSYWFDRIINALQTRDPIAVTHAEISSGAYIINRARGEKNWAEINRLLSDLKRLAPERRNLVVDDIVRGIPQEALRPFRIAPLSVGDVRELAQCPLVTIGAHSHCHNILTQIDRGAALSSVSQSRQLLESWTGAAIDYFAYPNGDCNTDVMGVVAEAGFKAAFTTMPRPWKRGDHVLALPRIGVGRYDSPETFKIKLVGGLKHFMN